MESRDAMVVDPTDATRHISRAVSSEPPCGPRRDPTEDADPTLTRKRQRLDSDARNTRSMSADGLISVMNKSDLAPVQADNTNNSAGISTDPAPDLPPSDTPVEHDLTQAPATPSNPDASRVDPSPHKRTPSKVTINLRTPRPDKAEENKTQGPVDTSTDDQRNDNLTVQLKEPTAQMDKDQQPGAMALDGAAATTPSSSPSDSPTVEAAEVEYMDSEYEPSGWAALVSDIAPIHAQTLVERFPCYQAGMTLKSLVAQVASALEAGPQTNGGLLIALSDWFALCARQAEQPGVDWYDVISEDMPFWEELPSVIEALLRRK